MPWDDVWKRIEAEFKAEIIDRMNPPKQAAAIAWLHSLKNLADGVHLVSCILIDIDIRKQGRQRIKPEVFAGILELLNHQDPPVRAFARALDLYESVERDAFWQDGFRNYNPQGRLARVMEIRPFIQ